MGLHTFIGQYLVVRKIILVFDAKKKAHILRYNEVYGLYIFN